MDHDSTIFHRQIKRLKTTHRSEIDSDLRINDSMAERFIDFDTTMEAMKLMNDNSEKKIFSKRWFIFLFLVVIASIYIYSSYLTKISKNLVQHTQKPIDLTDTNLISRYIQLLRNYFFSSLDFLIRYLGQLIFHIDKYQYKDNIIYVVTSTYEHLYNYFFTV